MSTAEVHRVEDGARVEKDQRYRDRQRKEIVAPLPGLHVLRPVNDIANGLPRTGTPDCQGFLRPHSLGPTAYVSSGAAAAAPFLQVKSRLGMTFV
jgi:hypothetical protein